MFVMRISQIVSFFFVRKHTCNAYILDQFLSLFMLESVFRYQYGWKKMDMKFPFKLIQDSVE